MRVYKRGICQNLHFDLRWYIFPRPTLNADVVVSLGYKDRGTTTTFGGVVKKKQLWRDDFGGVLDEETYTISS